MHSCWFFLKKHWKPPFQFIGASRILIFLYLVTLTAAAGSISNEDFPDTIEVIKDEQPYSIKFTLGDTENYQLVNVTCKGIKTTVIANSENVCENLEPCMDFVVTLSIKDLKAPGEPLIENIMDASTMYTVPQIELINIVAGIEDIRLEWTATDKTCISIYLVDVKAAGNQISRNVQSDKTEAFIDKLNPCQMHNINLQTFDINEKVISNITSTESTEYAEPGTIAITSIQPNHNQKGVTIKWASPQYNSCVDFYLVKWFTKDCERDVISKNMRLSYYRKKFKNLTETNSSQYPVVALDNNCEWYSNVSADAKEVVLNNLQGCEDYEVEFFINNIESVNLETNFTSPEQLPGKVGILPIIEEPTGVRLFWSPPEENRKCVDFYKIYVTGPSQYANPITFDTATVDEYTYITDLQPCGFYSYSVIPISKNGSEGAMLKELFETEEQAPSQVQTVYIDNKTNHTFTISWQPPAIGDLCVDNYRMIGWKEDESSSSFERTTNDTIVVVDSLEACQTYTIQIIATTKTAVDGQPFLISEQTMAVVVNPNSLLEVSVANFKTSPNSLHLSASVLPTEDKCGIIFAWFYCSAKDVKYQESEKYVEATRGLDLTYSAVLEPLSPFTNYRCTVSLYNVAGWSSKKELIVQTGPYYPDKPQDVKLKAQANDTLSFSWSLPSFSNGSLKLSYIAHLQYVGPAYYRPPKCESLKLVDVSNKESKQDTIFSNLQPYSYYSIQVAAQNEFGVGYFTQTLKETTLAYVSDPVTNLKYITQGPYDNEDVYQANVIVSFTAPCKSNGVIESFLVQFTGQRTGGITGITDVADKVFFERTVLPNFNEEGVVIHNETDIQPEYNYMVEVKVKTVGVATLSDKVMVEFESPAGIPKRLNNTAASYVRVNPYGAKNPTYSAKVSFPRRILHSESGAIMYLAILISEKGCGPVEELMRSGVLNPSTEWPNIPNWNQVYLDAEAKCILQYQTTPTLWNGTTVNNGRAISLREDNVESEGDDDTEIEYIIGLDRCENTSKRFCNGPLNADTDYYMVLRLFTKSGFNDVALLEFRTDSLIKLTIILVSIISILALAFIAGLIYLWIRKRITWQRDSCHGIEDTFGDVMARNFAIFYKEVSKPDKISREFKELNVVAMDLSYSASEIGCNKNRYADIFPYDKNRVILDIDADGSDYINASFIDGYRCKKEYIATQGPKPETVMDFWRMILQHNVRIIVQVTQNREGDVIKCHEYLPFQSKSIEVIVRKSDSFELYNRKELYVTHKYGLKQKVIHFYFKKWPDHGCPSDPMDLITFVRKVKAEKIPNYSPIVVHCSAGVGRTGTFIALDIIMQRLKNESKINIYEAVKKLRFQRMKMVQTIAQYSFLYACVFELVKTKIKHVRALQSAPQNNKPPQKLNDSEMPQISKNFGRRKPIELSTISEVRDSEVNSIYPNTLRLEGLQEAKEDFNVEAMEKQSL